MCALPIDLRELLTEVVSKHGIDRRVESAVLDGMRLSSHDREALINTLATELVETGLFDNDEPNSRGHQIENLIDRLNLDCPGN